MRCFYPLSALFLFGATAYALLRVQRVITFKGAAHVWEVMLEKEVVFIDILQYLPALLGVLLAVVQFVPEMAQKRLKLTLHLPFPQWKMILLMSGIGLGALALLFIVQTAVLWGYFHALLAPELVARILLTALPWYLAGLTLYLLTALFAGLLFILGTLYQSEWETMQFVRAGLVLLMGVLGGILGMLRAERKRR